MAAHVMLTLYIFSNVQSNLKSDNFFKVLGHCTVLPRNHRSNIRPPHSLSPELLKNVLKLDWWSFPRLLSYRISLRFLPFHKSHQYIEGHLFVLSCISRKCSLAWDKKKGSTWNANPFKRWLVAGKGRWRSYVSQLGSLRRIFECVLHHLKCGC